VGTPLEEQTCVKDNAASADDDHLEGSPSVSPAALEVAPVGTSAATTAGSRERESQGLAAPQGEGAGDGWSDWQVPGPGNQQTLAVRLLPDGSLYTARRSGEAVLLELRLNNGAPL
jgi:hypothetical protein